MVDQVVVLMIMPLVVLVTETLQQHQFLKDFLVEMLQTVRQDLVEEEVVVLLKQDKLVLVVLEELEELVLRY